MADIAVSNFAPVEIIRTLPGYAKVAITAGQVCIIDGTAGSFDLADASASGTAGARGVAMTSAAANMPLTLLRQGIIDIGSSTELDALAFDAAVYLSDTAGAFADAAGTVSTVVARVVPGHGSRPADRLLYIDL